MHYGTATHLNDLFETRAIRLAFGEHATKLKINSTKSMIGHLLGAAGAVEFVTCVKEMQENYVHATVGYQTPDEELDLDYCRRRWRWRCRTRSATLGFGGHNASLYLRDMEARRDGTGDRTDHGDPSAQTAVSADRCGGRTGAGKRAVARKCVSYNEPYFGGHFPGEPVMPGVLIVEALAQTGAVAILSMEENRGKTAYFAEINRARFKKKVVPGDVLTLTTEIIRQKGPIGIGSATASVRGEVVCTAELTFAIGSKEE